MPPRPFHDRPGVIVPLLVAYTALLYGVYVTAGFTVDDYALLTLFEQSPLPFSRLRGVWAATDLDFFEAFWYFGADWDAAFWRPIPSAVIEGSLRLFGRTAAPLHLLAVLLHAWVGVAGWLLVRKLTGRSLEALLTALLFLSCEKLGMVVGWVATLTDPICVSFVMGALLAHASWLRDRRPRSLVVALVLLVLAFPCKESAVLTPVLFGLLTFFAPAGHMPEGGFDTPLRDRVRALLRDWPSWLPGVAILAVYLVLYKVLGLGRMNNLMYVSPLEDPGGYLVHLVLNLPAMWLGTISPAWPSFSMFDADLAVPLAVGGVVALVTWVWALWPLRRDPLVQFSFLAYHLVLLPQMSADASERGMYLPMVLVAPSLAALVVRIGFIARRQGRTATDPAWTRLCAWWVATGVLVLGALLSLAMGPSQAASNAVGEREVETALPAIRAHSPVHVVVLNTSGMMAAFYPHPVIQLRTGRKVDVRVLSSASTVMSLERVGGRSFVLRSDRPGWLGNLFARLMRTEPDLTPGMTFENALFRATLESLTPDGGDALAVRFDFSLPLDDPALLFLTWDGTAYQPLDLASLPPGEERVLYDASDIWAALMGTGG